MKSQEVLAKKKDIFNATVPQRMAQTTRRKEAKRMPKTKRRKEAKRMPKTKRMKMKTRNRYLRL